LKSAVKHTIADVLVVAWQWQSKCARGAWWVCTRLHCRRSNTQI